MRKLLVLWIAVLCVAGLALTGRLEGKSNGYAISAVHVVTDGLAPFGRYVQHLM